MTPTRVWSAVNAMRAVDDGERPVVYGSIAQRGGRRSRKLAMPS